MVNRIRACRLNHNFPQRYVARQLGVSTQTVSYWETDQRVPSTENLRQLAELFDVTSDYLLGLTEDPHGHQDVDVDPYEPSDAELMRIPSIAMMAREMGHMTEAQRQQMLDVGRTLMRTFFNVEPEE